MNGFAEQVREHGKTLVHDGISQFWVSKALVALVEDSDEGTFKSVTGSEYASAYDLACHLLGEIAVFEVVVLLILCCWWFHHHCRAVV